MPYLREDLKQIAQNQNREKQKYLKQLSRMKQGLNPCSYWYQDDALHNSIREILGDKLSMKLINDVHKEIKHARYNRRSRE